MPASKSKIVNLRLILLCILSSSLFFSYYPIISMGETSTMNLEFSIPLIVLALFALISVPAVIKYLLSKRKLFFLTALFPIFATASLFWSANVLRGFLTIGIIWCIYFAIFSTIQLCSEQKNNKKWLASMSYIFLITTSVVCLFCWAQCILDVLGVGRETTLLCLGCTSETFGFPHPSGFAIEPQFMGNLLLFPSLVYVYLFLHFRNRLASRKNRIIFYCFMVLCISTLFLTFSRGAIYSFTVGLVVLLIFEFTKNRSLSPLKVAPIIILSFVISLTSQGLFSQFSAYDCDFMGGVTRVVDQLSLGIFHLSKDNQKTPSTSTAFEPEISLDSSAPIFDGYVAESTDTRVLLSDLALSAWGKSLVSVIFGYGLGASGVVINHFYPDIVDSKEIIQNELFTLLLEQGIFGVLSIIISAIYIIISTKKSPFFSLIISICASCAVSLMFFSGVANALHIYLFVPIFFIALEKNKLVMQEMMESRK